MFNATAEHQTVDLEAWCLLEFQANPRSCSWGVTMAHAAYLETISCLPVLCGAHYNDNIQHLCGYLHLSHAVPTTN